MLEIFDVKRIKEITKCSAARMIDGEFSFWQERIKRDIELAATRGENCIEVKVDAIKFEGTLLKLEAYFCNFKPQRKQTPINTYPSFDSWGLPNYDKIKHVAEKSLLFSW